MGAIELVRRVEKAGYRLEPAEENIRVRGASPLPRDLGAQLRQHKVGIRSILTGRACAGCETSDVHLTPTYWTDWQRALCSPCVVSVVADFDSTGWPPVTWDEQVTP